MSQTTPNNDFFVSVIVPTGGTAEVLADFVGEAARKLADNWTNWEIILVGNQADPAAEAVIADLLTRQDHLRYLRLSRRSGWQAAINVGLENAIGDCVLAMSPWNDPPELIPQAVRLAQERQAAVFGRRPEGRPGQSWLDRAGSRYIHRYCQRRLGTDLPHDATGFFCLGRRELNALLKIRDQRHPVLLSLYTGYPHVTLAYEPKGRLKRPRLHERAKLAYDILVAGHLHPLRVVSFIALLGSLLNLIYLGYVFVVFFFFPHVEAGWSSLSVQVSIMFFFLFLVLAVLSEYVGRLVRHGLDWPRVFIADERNSSVVAEDGRRNVIKE